MEYGFLPWGVVYCHKCHRVWLTSIGGVAYIPPMPCVHVHACTHAQSSLQQPYTAFAFSCTMGSFLCLQVVDWKIWPAEFFKLAAVFSFRHFKGSV